MPHFISAGRKVPLKYLEMPWGILQLQFSQYIASFSLFMAFPACKLYAAPETKGHSGSQEQNAARAK